ncbi:MAG: PASTA domain-containing protein [Paludibacter sp.]|nr:PASTA domain-containing protein [Paludibacter sp.]
MDFKQFWKESTIAFIIRRILLAIVIFVSLTMVTLFLLDLYTHHGESETVPDMRGLYIHEAEIMLANRGLFLEIIDSVYDNDKKLGTIIDQIPGVNSTVKRNRPIYLIINSRQMRQIPVPDITDVSFRQASAMIKAIGLNIANVEFQHSEYKDLVIDVKYRGVSITPGMRVPEGSMLVLVVGSGVGSGESIVPMLKGMNLENGKSLALSASLIIGAVEYDIQPTGNDNEYIIYRQRPVTGKRISSGTRIDVWLSKDRSLLQKTFEEDNDETTGETEEEFF